MKNILYLCHTYSTFQKDSIETSAIWFRKTHVIVRLNAFANILKKLPLGALKNINCSQLDATNKPSDICLYQIPIWYLPGNFSYRNLGVKHYETVNRVIEKNSIHFDIIHAHFIWSSGYAGARLKEEYSIPFVVTGHGYDIYSLPFKDDEWREKIEYVLNTADHIITVSQSNLACIRKLDVSTPVTVIPNGFRSDLFYPRDTSECKKVLNLPQDKKIILTVGNLEPVKGQRYLVEAVQEIVQERKDILCVIVGAGKLRTTLERQIRSLGLEDYVVLAGGKPHGEIPLWMNSCDLFVLPSLSEGNPTVMFEALGCGKPFVGTRVGGVPEIITSEDYGLLVEPADSADLAEKILVALGRGWDREAILAYAKRYTWENVAKEIVGVYERVLG